MKKTQPKYELVLTEKLVKCPWNYKDNDEAMSKKLVANINRNGQLETILVRELPTEALEIVNGNHRYDAICELGLKEVMVCNVGKISDAAAKRLAVELNETAFPNDILRLSGVLVDITKEFGEESIETLPYTEKELNKLLQAGTWDTLKEKKSGGGKDGDFIMLKIPVTFELNEKWQEYKMMAGMENDAQAFASAIEKALESGFSQPE